MRYLSVCSGIEAATVAWHSLGWEPVAFSEIEAFPCAVLKYHYPNVPNWGDMTKFQECIEQGGAMLAIGNDELGGPLGDTITCPVCGQQHQVERSETSIYVDGKVTEGPAGVLSFYSCGGAVYLCGIDGRALR